MVIMYLSNEYFTCPKEQIMHKEFSFADTIYKLIKNSTKPDLTSIENSVDPDQLASEEVSRSGSTLFSV